MSKHHFITSAQSNMAKDSITILAALDPHESAPRMHPDQLSHFAQPTMCQRWCGRAMGRALDVRSTGRGVQILLGAKAV